MKSISQLREEYSQSRLEEAQAHPDPIEQFSLWFDEAVQAQARVPNAMTLATVGADCRPSARVVLLKGVEEGCFVFYTNFDSRKGHELASSPYAALVFFWAELERQVRIEGNVHRVSDADADAYFRSRPRGSQLGSWASAQSERVASRHALEAKFAAAESRFANADVERPPHWGGFALCPQTCEFWQGRPNRLHDRIVYGRDANDGWRCERLAP